MRLAIGVEYHGANFFGWQRQKGVRTVQEELETALSEVANSTVSLICAGRTDAGVHALGQVAHFDTSVYREHYSWIQGGNSNLPKDLSISWCLGVPELFHARYLALARTYQYVIFNRKFRSGKLFDSTTWVSRNLDEKRMLEAADFLLGEHDFSSFRARGCQAKSPVREIKDIKISRRQEFVVITIKANGFLQKMVRNIAGLLIDVGSGKREPYWAKKVLLSRRRSMNSATAAPSGLYLASVDYPQEFGIPCKTAKNYFDWTEEISV